MRKVMTEGGYGSRLFGGLGIAMVGGLFAAAALGAVLALLERTGIAPGPAAAYRDFLAGGGWLKVPMWASAVAAVLAFPHARNWPQRLLTVWFMFEFGAMPFLTGHGDAKEPPQAATARMKTRAILKWSFRSPTTVSHVLAMSHDPDPTVREQAVLALGVNLIVKDVQNSAVTRPSRYADHPLRDSLRMRLVECLDDPVETVRGEAARALWNAPVAFGTVPAAAETLAAMLDRAHDPRRPERLAWLALDAAAGASHPGLKRAAERFATSTDDEELRRYARLAAEPVR